MRVSILPASHRPPPWGDPPSRWPVLLRPVAEHRDDALRGANCAVATPEPGQPQLVLSDALFLTPEFLRQGLQQVEERLRSQVSPKPLVLTLGTCLLARRLAARSPLAAAADHSLPMPAVVLPPGYPPPTDEHALLLLAAIGEPVVIDPGERTREVPAPRAWCEPGKETITFAGTTRFAIHLTHRTHLLQVNLEALGAHLLRALSGSRLRLALRWLLGRLLRGRRGLLCQLGRGVKIDRTAIVEGCLLGDGVEIGAHAIVRGAVLGAGASVEDGAHVHLAILGPRSRVARQTAVFASVLQEGAHSAQSVMQLSVLGRHAATTSASWFTDVRFGGEVKVELQGGGFVGIGSRFLGCDVGHDCVVGAGVVVAPGRMLPSHARVVADPAHLVSRLDSAIDPEDGLGQTLAVRDGRLVPLP